MNLDYLLGNVKGEKPLDNIVTDGGFTSMLRKIAVVGDSLASGEFQHKVGENPDGSIHWYYEDMFDYSWGQFMARDCGIKVYNFSQGGMTAKVYNQSFANNKGYYNYDLKCNAYIIALGANDLTWQGTPLGSIDDVCVEDYTKNNKETFAGNMGIIISKYRDISPDAKFFLMTFPKDKKEKGKKDYREPHRKLMYDLAKLFPHTYVIDILEYAPNYGDDDFRNKFWMYGHMAPAGYIFTAKIVESYIDYIIRHNFSDFKLVGFMNAPEYDEKDALAPYDKTGLE